MKRTRLQRIIYFFEHDIWRITVKDKHPVFSFFVRQGRILFIAVKGYNEDKIQLRASALSFYTLLAIVPILAMIFGIAQGFGLEDYVKSLLTEKFQQHQEILNALLQFVEKYLSRINRGYLTGISLIMLFWSVMKVLGNIENSFNNIWQIKKSRMLTRKFTDYISLLLIAPMFLIIASSINVTRLQGISENIPFLHYLGPFIKFLVTVSSYALIWIVFTLIYIVVPNTRVRFGPAFIAGIIGGTMFQLLQWGYVNFQSLLSGYGAVYGTFAALPLFMLWLEFSWLIVLLGAEISFAYQNAEYYLQEVLGNDVSHKSKTILILLVTRKIIKNFMDGLPAQNASELAAQLGVPVRLVREILYTLLNAKIITEALNQEAREVVYQPATDPSRITVSFVIEALDRQGQEIVSEKDIPEMKQLMGLVDSFYEDMRKSTKNALLKDM